MTLDQTTLQMIRTKLLGWGAATAPIYPGQDIGQDLTFANGDLAIVSGMDNLSQDLTIGLTTGLGSDPFNVKFGFDGVNALIDEQSALIARERVRISVIKLLNNDPRVSRILDVKLLDGRLDSVSTDLNTNSDTGTLRVLNVRVAFETVTGDQTALTFDGVNLNV